MRYQSNGYVRKLQVDTFFCDRVYNVMSLRAVECAEVWTDRALQPPEVPVKRVFTFSRFIVPEIQ